MRNKEFILILVSMFFLANVSACYNCSNETPNFDITSPLDKFIYNFSTIPLTINYIGNFSSWMYSLNDSEEVNFIPGETNLELENGCYTLQIYGISEDCTISNEVSFCIELEPDCTITPLPEECWGDIPHLTILNPIENEIYLSHNLDVSVIANQKIDYWGYILNGGVYTSFIPNSSLYFPLGENLLIVYGTNSNGTGMDYVKFYIETEEYQEYCGNNICGVGETYINCPNDCENPNPPENNTDPDNSCDDDEDDCTNDKCKKSITFYDYTLTNEPKIIVHSVQTDDTTLSTNNVDNVKSSLNSLDKVLILFALIIILLFVLLAILVKPKSRK